MRVVLLYQEADEDATIDEQDVIVQRDAVVTALKNSGHDADCLSCTLNLQDTRSRLLELRPDIVFNLVESLAGTDRLMVLATILLDAMEIPYTGTRSDGIIASANKLNAKQRMRAAGLPTPDWFVPDATADVKSAATEADFAEDFDHGSQWILKPILEHASFGIDDDAVVDAADLDSLLIKLRDREQLLGKPHFAERFIAGREFNLSILGDDVLPPAEIDFVSFPADKPRIVGHLAKWQVDSFEYQQTPRRFEFPAKDNSLLQELSKLTHRCCSLFGIGGYARVDFRIDQAGRPWILEVNANPCLSPDAGFAAAVTQAGLTFDEAVQRIVEQAFAGAPQSLRPPARV
jgi:D-alanine-D-alanine ligase